MPRLIGISGSLRKGSFNTSLLRAVTELMPAGSELEIGSIKEFPLYNFDLEEKDGVPQAVEQLKDKIAASDGLIITTPEYNNSMPGVLKNAIDWLSRPPKDISRVFGERPVAMMGATPGRGGTILGQNAWLPVLRTLGTLPYFGGRMIVSQANQVFDQEGKLVDQKHLDQLKKFLSGFVQFIEKHRGI